MNHLLILDYLKLVLFTFLINFWEIRSKQCFLLNRTALGLVAATLTDKPWTTRTKWSRKTMSAKTIFRNNIRTTSQFSPPQTTRQRVHWNTTSPKFSPRSATRSKTTSLANENRTCENPWDLSGSSWRLSLTGCCWQFLCS